MIARPVGPASRIVDRIGTGPGGVEISVVTDVTEPQVVAILAGPQVVAGPAD